MQVFFCEAYPARGVHLCGVLLVDFKAVWPIPCNIRYN